MKTRRPPILIIGMHRSGTSMVARLLSELGLFLGWRKQSDYEALFFLKLNDWLLQQCGGAWDHPEPVFELIANPPVRALVRDYLEISLRSPRSVSFLGLSNYLRYRSPANLPCPWGWKDPRTTFTLPLWLDLFPDARIVHITRHGVDVAQSLRHRYDRILASADRRYRRLRWTYWLRPKRSGFVTSLRCGSLTEGLQLWSAYMAEAAAHVRVLGDRAIQIRYEDLLADPADALGRLADFCGLDATRRAVTKVAGQARPERALAYRNDSQLQAFAKAHAHDLEAFGYEPA